MIYFGLMLILIALWCWRTSPVYRMQRACEKTRRRQERSDKKYARDHRA